MVPKETLGDRGHTAGPRYRSRRLLTRADERHDDHVRSKLLGLLDGGEPRPRVRNAWRANPQALGRVKQNLRECARR